MKRLTIPALILSSIALIALAGWLGYSTASTSGPTLPLPLAAASPTPNAPTRTVAVTRGDVRQALTVPGDVIAARQQQMGFTAGGRIVEITVRTGDTTTQGQTLARLDTAPLQLAVAQAQVEFDIKQAALDKLRAGPSATDLAAANAAIRDAQTALQNAQFNLTVVQNSDTVAKNPRERGYEAAWYETNYGEMLNKFNGGKIDKTRLDLEYNNLLTAKERYATAQTQAAIAMNQANQQISNAQETLRKAQESLATLKAGASATDIKQAETSALAAELALKKAQNDLAGATLVAPFNGRVLNATALVGDNVSANAAVITLADLTRLEVQTTVGQEDIAQVQPGQSATVTFDARAGETFAGKVSRMTPTKAGTSGAVTYQVFVALDKAPVGLLPGMTADADIIVAERKGVLTLPRRSIRARANATISLQVVQGEQTVTRNVRIGLVGDLNVEILSGLQEGDQVVSTQ
ncbi:MAG: efflux RND transporter periplasmic adaptor subunit [Chloroflexi bacterium]|nr:efflux RND transporter periplasmic adaptor subunit [Chloroflexota bacterium]